MRLYLLKFVVVGMLLTSLTVEAQIPALSQQQPIALVHATIHPVASEVISKGILVFDQGKITDLGTEVIIPADGRIIDLQGRHVYPAFIQATSSLGLTEIGAVRVTNDTAERGDINPNVRPEMAINPETAHIPVARANGVGLAVTTPSGGIISGQTALIEMDGWTWKEMTYKAPLSMMIQWPRNSEQRQRLDRALTDAQAYHRATRHSDASLARHKTDVRWEAMMPVLDYQLPVWIQANSLLDIQAAVAWAREHKFEMVLVGGRDALACADLLLRHDIPVLLTSVLRTPSRRDGDFDEAFVLPRRLHEAGLRFCIASGGASGVRDLPYHAAKAASYGLPKAEALKSVTLYAAQILGVDNRLGSLEEGKDATLMITDGDPLEITTQVHALYLQGRDIDLNNKHRQLYEKYKMRYERMK
ncbi:amidohydrolase family protein [Planctomycetota bacterium]